MLRSFTLAVGQLGDPRIMRVVLKSMLITLLIFVMVGVGLDMALNGWDPCAWVMDEGCPLGTGGSSLAAIILTFAAIWLLFPAVAVGVIAGFMDQIIRAVELRHYPEAAARARPLGWIGGMALGLKSSARLLLYNLVALPFYLLLLITGVGPFLLFLAVNGVALGRDLGDMVASRHLDRTDRKIWFERTRVPRTMTGVIAAGLFMIPFVNLIAPVIGAAMATHMFHRNDPI